MTDNFKESALRYHTEPVPGKLAILPTKPMSNKRDLARAYSPGVAYACEAIVEQATEAARMTARGNLVGVITNGTAVLGLGNIGPLASKPVMEGKAVLFKKFANIDVFDIEVNETDVDRLVEIIAALEPTFGGINLEDIKAPECFLVEARLRERMNIPVFHDDQHGTAIVAAAAVYNGLRVVDKAIANIHSVVSGSGAASIACVDLLVSMGLDPAHITLIDRSGVVHDGRDGLNPWKQKYARNTELRTLDDAIEGADLFLGLSAPGVLTPDMVKKMAPRPLILAMANPTPEIMPELAREVRPDAILATGRSDYPNQVNNVLCFPFIFRGALDCGATTINEAMKQAAVKAIADLAMKQATEVVAEAYAGEDLTFGPDYLIPKPFDPRLIEEVPVAVVQAAMDSGVATRPIEDLEAYRRKLHEFVNAAGLFMQPMIEAAKQGPKRRLVYAEGENDDVLMAMQAIVDEGVARPILLARREIVASAMERLGLRFSLGEDVEVFDPRNCDRHDSYWQHYHERVGRKGITVEAAKAEMRQNPTALAATMVSMGEAHGMICGKVNRYATHFQKIREVLGTAEPDGLAASVCALLLPSGPLFIADAFLNLDPDSDALVRITEAGIDFVRQFGTEPKVALLSHSNFGSSASDSARKVREAAARLRAERPDVEVDGEMHALTAMNEELRKLIFPAANLKGSANLLIMPNLDAANIALGLIRSLTDALLIGPFLTGISKPAHIVIPSVSARGIFNMSALTAAHVERYCEDNSCRP